MSAYDDYYDEILSDAKDYIDTNIMIGAWDADTDIEDIYDDMFCSDDVCGNGHKPQNDATMFSFLVDDDGWMFSEFGVDGRTLQEKLWGKHNDGRRWLDATIRCYLLGQVMPDIEKYWDAVRPEGEE